MSAYANYKDPEARREYMREYMREWQNTPERKRAKRDQYLRRTYGITADRFDEILESQGFGCRLCGGVHASRHLHVDHCHETGKVRGVLCSNCNSGLHTVEKMGIEAVVEYLAGPDLRE